MNSSLEFSKTASDVLDAAKSLAERMNNDYIDVRHIVISIYTMNRGLAYRVMLKNAIVSFVSLPYGRVEDRGVQRFVPDEVMLLV